MVPVRLLLSCFKEKPQCYHQSSAELFQLKASICSLPTQRRQVHCRVSARVNSKDRQSLILYLRLFSKDLRGGKAFGERAYGTFRRPRGKAEHLACGLRRRRIASAGSPTDAGGGAGPAGLARGGYERVVSFVGDRLGKGRLPCC